MQECERTLQQSTAEIDQAKMRAAVLEDKLKVLQHCSAECIGSLHTTCTAGSLPVCHACCLLCPCL